MRFYLYKCWDCEMPIHLSLGSRDQKVPPRHAVCPGCLQLCEQDYTQKNVMADAFEAYTEKHLPGGPVEFHTKRQRDEVMASTNSTYDSNRYNRGFKRTPWEKHLTFAKAASIASGRQAKDQHEPDLD